MVCCDIAHLVIPAAIEYALLQLVNMFDQIQVGILGANAIAAVGIATQVKLILVTAFVAVNIGVTALIVQSLGEGNKHALNHVLEHRLLLVTSFSLLSAILGYFFAEPILVLMETPDRQTLALGISYLRVSMFSVVSVAVASTFTAALRDICDTRSPLVYNVIANGVNIILNWLLITGKLGFPSLGIEGAAWATVIGQLVALIIAICLCAGESSSLRFNFRNSFTKVAKHYIKEIMAIGLPSMGEQVDRSHRDRNLHGCRSNSWNNTICRTRSLYQYPNAYIHEWHGVFRCSHDFDWSERRQPPTRYGVSLIQIP